MQNQTGSFPYGKDLKSYHYGEIVTPYQKPQKEFDSCVGQYIQKARMWRIGFVSACGMAILLLFIFILLMNASPFSIYAVGITNKGYTKQANLLQNQYNLPRFSYEDFVRKTISYAISGDIQSKAWMQKFLSPESRLVVERFIQLNYKKGNHLKFKDFKLEKNDTLLFSIEIYNAAGITQTFILKSVIISNTPQDVALIKLNPLGLYMEDIVFRVTLGNGIFKNLGKEDGKKQG